MTVHVVVQPIPPIDGEPPPQRVLRQRKSARDALRRCAELCGAPPEGWTQAAGGAPRPNGHWHWSISHTRQMAAAAIAEAPVGVDVEAIAPRRRRLFDAVADDVEWPMVGGRTWPGFFRLWTAKEAVLKANGLGIGHLSHCRIVRTDKASMLLVRLDRREWLVEHLAVEQHVVAVARAGGDLSWSIPPHLRTGRNLPDPEPLK